MSHCDQQHADIEGYQDVETEDATTIFRLDVKLPKYE